MPEQLAYNIDCMEYLKTVPDKYFDLAVVDPPYGDCSQAVKVERERERGRETVIRTGGLCQKQEWALRRAVCTLLPRSSVRAERGRRNIKSGESLART